MQTTTNTTKIIIAISILILIGLGIYIANNRGDMVPVEETASRLDSNSDATTTVSNRTSNSNTTSVNSNGTTNGSMVVKPGQVMTVTPKKNPLSGTSWIWKDTSFNNRTTSTIPGNNKFVITFGTDGAVTSSTDCNSVSGRYAVTNDRITISNTASTKMACQGATLETTYVQQLTQVTNFVFESTNELDLAIGNTGTMSFSRR